jgi:hypothetical protein
MVDRFDFSSPFGLLGAAVDKLFLAGYMHRLLVKRHDYLKGNAERASAK